MWSRKLTFKFVQKCPCNFHPWSISCFKKKKKQSQGKCTCSNCLPFRWSFDTVCPSFVDGADLFAQIKTIDHALERAGNPMCRKVRTTSADWAVIATGARFYSKTSWIQFYIFTSLRWYRQRQLIWMLYTCGVNFQIFRLHIGTALISTRIFPPVIHTRPFVRIFSPMPLAV